ncbi:hypothetical protein SLEP1_g51436 [Rubroshorea leprosula]|uniref:Uncharacterized protein n=1 Tax=Rubroshorea leprosula TaxID=152421 RepID=A0AAV5M5P3_9ROSI|nr:hypothetical protein SLEP1_g51436 [Rubroshorea leprosula]
MLITGFHYLEKISNQAMWSVLLSFNVLKWHRHAHRAAVRALESGDSLSIEGLDNHRLFLHGWAWYCMVLFAGIAAEALVYGEAEGGENDENMFRSICVLLQLPLSVAQ